MERYAKLLAGLDRRGRLRRLAPRTGIDFASNDYLGLARSPELRAAVEAALERGVPVGAGASRLLRGNDPEHEALEAEAAALFGGERALYFSNGFMANFALWSLLPERGDLIVYDELIHASCHEGMRAGRAETSAAKHNDAQAVDDAIAAWRARGGTGQAWISVESVYSMDGDKAPLADLLAIAAKHEAMLVIDEAHASGMYGPGGRGLAAELKTGENVIVLHTCGKALGAQGALVCAAASIVDFLVNRSRPFIYSTAPSPLLAATVRESLRLVERGDDRRARLNKLVTLANAELHGPGTQIIPVIIGASARTMAIAEALQSRGFDVRGIRPPTVPEGTSRLRLSITLNVDETTTRAMLDALAEALAAQPA